MQALRNVYGKTLVELGEKYTNIVVLDADLSKSTKTGLFKKRFPDRFFDMGISEQDMISTAAGIATTGLIPFVSSFAIFAVGRAWEQVRNSVCYPNLNVKIVATHAGITVGQDGASHQALEDIATTRVIPNLKVIVPCDAIETEQVIRMLPEIKGPVYVRLGRIKVPDVNNKEYKFELGKGTILKEGTDLTIIACGIMVDKAVKAAEQLEKQNVSAQVINISTIKPIDKNIIISAAQKTGKILTCEEHNIYGGLGSAVSEVVSQNCPVKMKILGIEDTFGESGPAEQLLEKYGLSSDNIIKKSLKLINK